MERMMGQAEISDAQVEEWVSEAEAEYPVEKLRAHWGRNTRGAAPARMIPVRLTEEELSALMARATREGMNRSDAIRAALDAWTHAA